MSNKQKLSYYKQVDLKTRVDAATPGQLIQMLLEGAMTALAEARGAMERDEIELRGQAITRAIDIISGLRDSLNFDVKEELPYDLDRLYDYMQRRLLEAHAQNKLQALIEVSDLLSTIKSGWDQISR